MKTKAETDQTLLPRLLAVIAVGAGRNAAAAQAGISAETLRRYEKLGAEAVAKREADEQLTERDLFWADFHDQLLKAETSVKVYALGLIKRAAAGDPESKRAGDWRAAAWLLERLYPREFGKHHVSFSQEPEPAPEQEPASTGPRRRLYEVK